MDTQSVEIIGRHRLIAELLRADLEVAIPARDRGIDLIAYADLKLPRFAACPIQMKAAIGSSFSIDTKYEKFPNLLIVYVWYLEEPDKAVTYATTYAEAKGIAAAMGYTNSDSFKKGSYVNTKPSPRLVTELEPFEMNPDEWRRKVIGTAAL